MISAFKNREIEFLCAPEDYGVIPAPFPAGKEIPDWFKALPPKTGNGFKASTVKRCMPFLDSMLAGYIIPLATDVHIQSNDDGSGVTWNTEFHKPIIETHSPEQVSTTKAPNPIVPMPPLKFLNYWCIKTPKDYSLLFVQPLNRHEPRFMLYSGIVDYPYYQHEYVNFPGVFTQTNFDGIIPAGTPLMQVIPIKKDNFLNRWKSRIFTQDEMEDTTKTRMRRNVHESLYRDHIHKGK